MRKKALFFCIGMAFAQFGGDTFPLAEPVWVWKKQALSLPIGTEVLRSQRRGDTLWVQIRFWRWGRVEWRWDKDTFQSWIQVPPLPPDSLMPRADYRVPLSHRTETLSSPLPTGWFLWGGIGILLLALLRLTKEFWRTRFHRIVLWLRWWVWLWRWRHPRPSLFFRFVHSIKENLRLHSKSHPGSLTLLEIEHMPPDSFLRKVLHPLVQLEYRRDFWKEDLSPAEILQTWREVWKLLWQSAPPLSNK